MEINTTCTPASTAPGWVYFVRYEDRIKIGFAQRPYKRFFALKGASPVPLTMLGAMRGNALTERALHKRWAGSTRRNEWVDATPELLKFIADHTQPVTQTMDRESRERKTLEFDRRALIANAEAQ